MTKLLAIQLIQEENIDKYSPQELKEIMVHLSCMKHEAVFLQKEAESQKIGDMICKVHAKIGFLNKKSKPNDKNKSKFGVALSTIHMDEDEMEQYSNIVDRLLENEMIEEISEESKNKLVYALKERRILALKNAKFMIASQIDEILSSLLKKPLKRKVKLESRLQCLLSHVEELKIHIEEKQKKYIDEKANYLESMRAARTSFEIDINKKKVEIEKIISQKERIYQETIDDLIQKSQQPFQLNLYRKEQALAKSKDYAELEASYDEQKKQHDRRIISIQDSIQKFRQAKREKIEKLVESANMAFNERWDKKMALINSKFKEELSSLEKNLESTFKEVQLIQDQLKIIYSENITN